MREWAVGGLLLLALCSVCRASCGDGAEARAQLLALREARFVVEDSQRRQQLAVELVGCLGDADPKLRDGVAFEGLSTWLRADALGPETLITLHGLLLAALREPVDTLGLKRPFVALALAELSRADRIAPKFDAPQRAALVDTCVEYLAGITDYRGFEEQLGWRHQVAHAADWVLQLALNPQLQAADVARLLTALATQHSPPGVAWRHGEPQRIARAVFFAHQRGVLDAEFWDAWFAGLLDPAPHATWRELSASEAGLARKHNLDALLLALHFAATAREGHEDAALRARVLQAMTVVGG